MNRTLGFVVLITAIVAIVICCRLLVQRSKNEYDKQEKCRLEFWIVNQGRGVEVLVDGVAFVNKRMVNSILHDFQTNVNTCSICIRVSKGIEVTFAYSILETAQTYGYTDVSVRLNEDLSSELCEIQRRWEEEEKNPPPLLHGTSGQPEDPVKASEPLRMKESCQNGIACHLNSESCLDLPRRDGETLTGKAQGHTGVALKMKDSCVTKTNMPGPLGSALKIANSDPNETATP